MSILRSSSFRFSGLPFMCRSFMLRSLGKSCGPPVPHLGLRRNRVYAQQQQQQQQQHQQHVELGTDHSCFLQPAPRLGGRSDAVVGSSRWGTCIGRTARGSGKGEGGKGGEAEMDVPWRAPTASPAAWTSPAG